MSVVSGMFPESLAPAAQYNIDKKIFLAISSFQGFGKRREVGLWKEDNFSRKNVRKSTFSFKTVRDVLGRVR